MELVRSFAELVRQVAFVFTVPTYSSFVIVLAGWVFARRRTVTRTWGGVNGIRGDKTFIDGGLSTQPEFAWWDPQRGWNLENHGVDPDIVVEFLPEDWIGGRDPQLDRGLAELEKMLKEEPVERPQPPPIRDKSRIVP